MSAAACDPLLSRRARVAAGLGWAGALGPAGSVSPPRAGFARQGAKEKQLLKEGNAFNVSSFVLRAMMSGQYWPEGDEVYHAELTVPVLLVHGMHDKFVPVEEDQRMAEVGAGSRSCHTRRTVPVRGRGLYVGVTSCGCGPGQVWLPRWVRRLGGCGFVGVVVSCGCGRRPARFLGL